MKLIMWKWVGLAVLVIGAGLLPLFLPEGEKPSEFVQPMPSEQPGYTVMLNRYAPEDWNGGYGHYDLSFLAADNRAFGIKLGEKRVECREIILSYGATDGDLSPARVHLYTAARSDHLPTEQLSIYDGLTLEDFNAFVVWFMGTFAAYSKETEEYHVFSVEEEAYAVYSLAEDRNCLSAALHMALSIPGIKDVRSNPCAALVERLEVGLR